MKEKLFEVQIYDEKNNLIDSVKTNQKGAQKSLENGNLWIFIEENGRVLPYSDKKFLKMEKKGNKIEVVMEKKNCTKSTKKCGKVVDNVDKSIKNSDLEQFYASNKVNEQTLFIGTFFQKLESLIKERHKTMPEGSYTTHLFKSGGEKIRKKTGEEAVELILAKGKKAIVYEAADLVYHLMVLLESEKISFIDLVKELESRP